MTSFSTHVVGRVKMALFSDDLFNVFDEEAEPVSSRRKRRQREEKEGGAAPTEDSKKPKIEVDSDLGTASEPAKGSQETFDAVIQGGSDEAKEEEP